jgi:ankyrin repeat protein
MVALFLVGCALPGHPSDDGVYVSTPLIDAIGLRDESRINALLSQGVDVNKTNSEGEAPLAIAAMAGNTALMKELLRRGADIDHRALNGETALMEAAYVGDGSTALLLVRGANPCVKNKQGQTALELAEWAERANHQRDAAVILRAWFRRHRTKCTK